MAGVMRKRSRRRWRHRLGAKYACPQKWLWMWIEEVTSAAFDFHRYLVDYELARFCFCSSKFEVWIGLFVSFICLDTS